jgi:hypothetical protein
MYVWIDLKIHKEWKLFALFKSFIRKTILNFLFLLEELNWENKNSKYYFDFIQIL